MIRSTYQKYTIEIRVGLLIFILAAVLRLLYQYESVPTYPIMKDAKQYFLTAYNLHRHGAFSDELESFEGYPPQSRTDLSPGYPVFLSFFIREPVNINEYLHRVCEIQALLGALTALFAFCIARMVFNTRWAALAGVLTAISPHLIAIDGYLLTESLFSFLLLSATLLCAIAWKYQYSSVFFSAGAVFAMSYSVRAVNQLLALFIAPILFINPNRKGFLNKKVWGKQLLFFFFGFLLIIGMKSVFQHITAIDPYGVQPKPVYSSVSGFWHAFLLGSYPGLKDEQGKLLRINDPELPLMLSDKTYAIKILKKRFTEEPLTYLKWYFGGKILALWNWDDNYVKDVYIYPMRREGFEENLLLRFIHRLSRAIHWPIFLLALISPLWFFFAWRRKSLQDRERLFLLTICVFWYYLLIFSVLQPLTRYISPVRPIVYISAVASLSWFTSHILSWLKWRRQPS